MTGSPARRTLWGRLGLLLLGLVIGLCVVEVSLRLFSATTPVFDDYDADRGVRLCPGLKGWYTKEGQAYVEVNSLGYRDVEHSKAKPPGVFRIAVLGDSFTEARQVDLKSTFWKMLESKLDSAEGLQGRKVEAMSFGIGGYGTSQELITLEKDVLGFSPDLVLLAYFNGNDLVNNSRSLSLRLRGEWMRPFHTLENGHLVLDASFRDRTRSILLRRCAYFILHHCRTAEFVSQIRRSLEVRREKREAAAHAAASDAAGGEGGESHELQELGLDDAAFTPPRSPEWEETWAVTEAVIVEIDRLTRRASARFALVVLGDPIQVDLDVQRREKFAKSLGVEDLFYTERRLSTLAERSGFPVITLGPRLQERADREHVALHGFSNSVIGTGHWNETGHRFVADLLAADLIRLGLVR